MEKLKSDILIRRIILFFIAIRGVGANYGCVGGCLIYVDVVDVLSYLFFVSDPL